MDLHDVHVVGAWVVVVGNAIAGVWALGAHRWAALRHPALWWFTAVAEVAIAVEVVLGVLLVAPPSDDEPRRAAVGRPEELEALEPVLVVDGARTRREAPSQLVAGVLGDRDGVDLHNRHAAHHCVPPTVACNTPETCQREAADSTPANTS